MLTARNVLVGGLLLRAGMLLYGLWQDANMTVKYTDIDYNVFSDAARFVWEGGSPYQRSTYRYTPLLAWVLTPNAWLHPTFGKWLFVACDCVVGALVARIVQERGMSEQRAAAYSALWLLNPQVANISTRGSAESVVCAAVMAALYAIQRRQIVLGSMLFGLAVHLKIYPIIYALPLLVVLDRSAPEARSIAPPAWPKASSSGNNKIKSGSRLKGWVNAHRVCFFIVSASVFFLLSTAMYCMYGQEFVHETYLYHVARKDHRHNYSMWFLPIYLTFRSPASVAMGLLSFLPQAVVVAVLGFAYGQDLYFAAFAQTFAFVAYNKVCTAQYFMWYMCFLPVIWPYNSQRLVTKGLVLLGVWFGTQALYLQQAYRLEFLGENTFAPLWLAGLVIFAANNWVLQQIIASQRVVPLFGSSSHVSSQPLVKKSQ
ncbi:GPI mannosyltransferase 1 [Coemansia linderi]|uniref:GPI mannosyltransferase 1 n=1 Tax=Coemansia linderi TaxID=2663919 RepID=A0ACC1KP73_9FUNG|nr:GPI mannosyltransferase 1 [Coemansia linderi]